MLYANFTVGVDSWVGFHKKNLYVSPYCALDVKKKMDY